MTGQTMISAAFFVMLTAAVLSANRMIIESSSDYLQEEAIEQATNFAGSLISEILTKKFDSQVTVDGTGKITGPYTTYNWPSSGHNPTLFDDPSAMGTSAATSNYVMPGGAPDSLPYKSIRGDSPSYFDDVDDYHGYKRIANSSDISGYLLKVSVYYVKKSSPDVSSSVETFYKRIDVTVEHPIYLPRKLSFSAIATY